ncbi:uncharacterized protein [Argopecten irradians]|uniref:uncharacterized protein n=1 Tax=Argopecten irradians TaxID=31199 RepID=UPI00371A5EC8
MEICKTRSITASSIMLDFYPAQSISVDQCECTVLIYQGTKLLFNPVSTPGYLGCGSEVHIQRYLPRGENRIIPCLGATNLPGLAAGNTISITLKRVHEPYDTSYCYRLDLEGKAASMSLICENAKTTSTVSITTSTIPVTTDFNAFTGGNQSSHVETPDSISLPSLTGPGTIVMTTVLSILIIYSTVITLLYIMSRRKKQQPDKTYSDIYEEIPPRAAVWNRESCSTRLASISDDRVLPTIPHPILQRQYSQYNANSPPSSANSVNKQTHWNWTYQEKVSNKEQEYVNQQ